MKKYLYIILKKNNINKTLLHPTRKKRRRTKKLTFIKNKKKLDG
jgi:hypothetical protein